MTIAWVRLSAKAIARQVGQRSEKVKVTTGMISTTTSAEPHALTEKLRVGREIPAAVRARSVNVQTTMQRDLWGQQPVMFVAVATNVWCPVLVGKWW